MRSLIFLLFPTIILLESRAFRLPETARPESYDIFIIPILPINGTVPESFAEWTALGSVQIVFEAAEMETNVIVLHADNITVDHSTVKVTRLSNQHELTVRRQLVDKEHNFYKLILRQPLIVGERYRIDINYQVYITHDNYGIYRGFYEDEEGSKRWFVTTFFPPTWFRRMVPGFDEPQLKANFTLHIGRSPFHNSVSNMPYSGEPGQPDDTGKLPPGWIWDHFQATVKMSTYLLAFLVSDFAYETVPNGGMLVRVAAPAHLISRGGAKLAVAESAAQINNYERILGFNFALPKMDNIAIPRPYQPWAAMENWGVITYSDELLLYYEKESTEAEKYNIVKMISHETAHQWFGNLVTCKWWSNVFLNEGFATYMSFTGTQHTHPEFEPKRKFLYEALQPALLFDAGPSSHAVTDNPTREQIEKMEMYDKIAYEKGASLISMLENVLGEVVLFQGLQNYLTQMQYGSATEYDLYEHLQKFGGHLLPAGMSVESFMTTWTATKGFPLVTVKKAGASNIEISQKPFDVNKTTNDDRWHIPVAIATPADPTNTKPKVWLTQSTVQKLFQVDTSNWFIVNPGAYGYYRVLYDTPLMSNIINQLKAGPEAIDGLSRAQLISDYFAFADAGIVPYESALELIPLLKNEVDHVVWMTAFTSLNKIIRGTSSTRGGLEQAKPYIASLAESALDLLGWTQSDGERGINVTLRSNLLELARSMGSVKFQQLALSYLNEWMKDPSRNSIPNDVQNVICCGAVAANSSLATFVLDRYESYANLKGGLGLAQEIRLARALTCNTDADDLVRLLGSLAHHNSSISNEHIHVILTGMLNNPVGRNLAAEYVKENWKQVVERTGGHEAVTKILADTGDVKNSPEDLVAHDSLVDAIRTDNSVEISAEMEVSLNETRKKIQDNILWADKHLNSVADWIRNVSEIEISTSNVEQFGVSNSASVLPSSWSTKTHWADLMEMMSFVTSFAMFTH